tara:strand:- start:573 stop:1007 length:435 start_codon:yes stop_codon:yes gene_type:complete
MIACPRGGRPAAALLFLLLLTACQTVPPPERADARPQQRLDVPFIPQEAYQCGPAALGMMLQWNGLPGDKTELVDEVWLPERQGALGIELVAAGPRPARLSDQHAHGVDPGGAGRPPGAGLAEPGAAAMAVVALCGGDRLPRRR